MIFSKNSPNNYIPDNINSVAEISSVSASHHQARVVKLLEAFRNHPKNVYLGFQSSQCNFWTLFIDLFLCFFGFSILSLPACVLWFTWHHENRSFIPVNGSNELRIFWIHLSLFIGTAWFIFWFGALVIDSCTLTLCRIYYTGKYRYPAENLILSLRNILVIKVYLLHSLASGLLSFELGASHSILMPKEKLHILNAIQSWKYILLIAAPELYRAISWSITIEKLLMQRISTTYHSKHYFNRISENKFALDTLEIIRKRTKVLRKIFSNSPNRKSRRLFGPWIRCSSAQEVPTLKITDSEFEDSSSSTCTNDSTALTSEEIFDIIRLTAHRISEYGQLEPNSHPRDSLKAEDFEPFVLSKNSDDKGAKRVAKKFAEILDADGNGDLTRREVIDGFARIFDEKECLSRMLASSDALLKRLDGLLSVIALILSLLAVIGRLDINGSGAIWRSVTTLGGIALGCKFVVESTISGLVSSILCTLIEHPFDIGDSVWISDDPYVGTGLLGGSTYNVVDVGLLTSEFSNSGGKCYISNGVLSKRYIANISRSPWQSEIFAFPIDPTFPNETDTKSFSERLHAFELLMKDFCIVNNRDYQVPFRISSVLFHSNECFIIECCVGYRSNFSDASINLERRHRINQFIMNSLVRLGIQLASPSSTSSMPVFA